MTPVWTWGGSYFGELHGADVYTLEGVWYARLCPNAAGALFNERGEYVAELLGDRLVVNRAKRRPAWRADDLPGGWSRLTPRHADRKPAAEKPAVAPFQPPRGYRDPSKPPQP